MALKRLVHLSKEQYNTLLQNGSITVSGVTYTYSPDTDEYLVPDDVFYNHRVQFEDDQTNVYEVEIKSSSTTLISDANELYDAIRTALPCIKKRSGGNDPAIVWRFSDSDLYVMEVGIETPTYQVVQVDQDIVDEI